MNLNDMSGRANNKLVALVATECTMSEVKLLTTPMMLLTNESEAVGKIDLTVS